MDFTGLPRGNGESNGKADGKWNGNLGLDADSRAESLSTAEHASAHTPGLNLKA